MKFSNVLSKMSKIPHYFFEIARFRSSLLVITGLLVAMNLSVKVSVNVLYYILKHALLV